MAVNAVIAESLNIEVSKVRSDARLTADLDMSPIAKKRLQRELFFIFDTTEINISDTMKVGELVGQVANSEFKRLTRKH